MALNVDAMARLLELSESAGVGRFVHCSTVGVYGPIETLPADVEFLEKASLQVGGESLVPPR